MITRDKIAAVLYILMRDDVTFGRIEQIIEALEYQKEIELSNEHLASYAKSLARRLETEKIL